ncbi:uroporphyrinogen-III synthase [Marinobacter sp.]|uniref:uroporphyrinogen-III synthase n=1 Tax=Marinobacter sp. TaxID=50741 RepID=UPI00384AEA13
MATHLPEAPLKGKRVLVCRPRPEGERLAEHLTQAGARVRLLPLLDREELPETPAQRSLVQNLDLFRHVIAVSPHAARLLLARVDTWWPQLPVGLHWYGVGAGTAAVLESAGLTPGVPAGGFTSEHLLELPGLQLPEGERVLIARGEGGRELIRDTLLQRGADVSELLLYRRQCPAWSADDISSHLDVFAPDAIVVLSGETLNNLIALGKNSDHNLQQRLLVVPVERVAKQARAAGFQFVKTPDSLDDRAIARCIAGHLACSRQNKQNNQTK